MKQGGQQQQQKEEQSLACLVLAAASVCAFMCRVNLLKGVGSVSRRAMDGGQDQHQGQRTDTRQNPGGGGQGTYRYIGI